MKSTPLLFSAPMVRAILAGNKTQTRRLMKPQPHAGFQPRIGPYNVTIIGPDGEAYPSPVTGWGASDENVCFPCPYGQPGDRLWVRETWSTTAAWDDVKPRDMPENGVPIRYHADNGWIDGKTPKTRVSIFMMQWMARITLELTAVRVERLNAISEADAIAEGIPVVKGAGMIAGEDCYKMTGNSGYMRGPEGAKLAYRTLWESLNGPGSWVANPLVWVLEFRRVTP